MNTILRKQFLAHVGQTSPEPMMIEVARAEGVFFYTPEGKRYYDLVAGVSVSNVGHANPRVVDSEMCIRDRPIPAWWKPCSGRRPTTCTSWSMAR